MKLGMQVGLVPGHIVLGDGPSSLSPKGAQPLQFLAHIGCGQMASWIKMSLGMEVGLGPGDFMLDGGPSSPLPKREHSLPPPKFSAHVYCGQTAGWMKLVLGMEVGLSPGDFVLYGDPAAPPLKGHSPSNFRPVSVVAKRMDGLRSHLVWR